MAKPTKKNSKPAQEQPAIPVPVPAKKKRKAKKRRPAVARQKPLPPPVEPQAESQDPFQLAATFNQNPGDSPRPSGGSSISNEPKPGEPLSPEREQVLRDGFEQIGVEQPGPGQPGGPSGVTATVHTSEGAEVADMLIEMKFDVQETQDLFLLAFHRIADWFDSAHWELDEVEARALAKPATRMLSSFYSRLPEVITHWCDSTPGLGAFLAMSAIVIVPKAKYQMAISRERRKAPTPINRPQAVPGHSQPAPVGRMQKAAEIVDQ